MKLLVIIVQDQAVQQLLEQLMENGIGATKLASTGGFLRTGNTTLLSGVEDEMVAKAFKVIEQVTKKYEQVAEEPPTLLGGGALPGKVRVGGAIIFVVDVERFEKI